MENYSTTYKPALEEARNSEGSSEKKYEAYSDSVTAALQRYAAAWEGFAEKLNASPLIINLVNILTKLTGVLEFVAPKLIQFFSTYFAYKIPGMIDSAKGLLGLPGGDFIRNAQTMGIKGALKEAGSTIMSPAKKAFGSATMGRRAAWEARDEKMEADLAKHNTDYTGALDDARARMGKGAAPVVPVKEAEKPKEAPKAETTPTDEGMVTKTADQLNVDQQSQQAQQGQTGTPQLVPVQNQPQGEAPATPGEAPVELDNEAANKNNQAADKMSQAADKMSQAADKMVANAGQEQPLGSSPNMSPDAKGYVGTGKTVAQGTATGELVSDASGKQFIKVKGKQIGTKSEFVANPNFDKGKFDPSGILTPYGALTNENFELSKSGRYKLKWSKIKEQELGTHTQLSRLRTTELPQSEKTTPVYGYDYIPYVGKGEPEQPKYKPETTYQKKKKKGSGGGDDNGTGAGRTGKPSAKQRLKSNAYYAAAAGVSTFATNANEYGYQGVFGGAVGYNDVKLDEGEKWGLAGVTGAGTAALTAWLGPIGQILSQVINDFVYAGWKALFHAEDKARADRVKAAKENLDSLNKMTSAAEKASSITSKNASEMDALDFSSLQSAADDLKTSFNKLNGSLRVTYNSILTKYIKGFNIKGIDNFSEAVDSMLNNAGDDNELAQKIAAAIEASQMQITAEETYKSEEETRNKAIEKITSDEYLLVAEYNSLPLDRGSGYGVHNRNRESVAREYKERYGKNISEGVSELQSAKEELKASYNDLLSSSISSDIIGSGLGLMSEAEAKRIDPQILIRQLAQDLSKNPMFADRVYDVTGQVSSEFKQAATLALKNNETTNLSFTGSGVSLSNMRGMKAAFDKVDESVFKNYEKWRLAALSKNESEEFKNLAHNMGVTTDVLRGLILQANPDTFRSIADGIGLTVEELEKSGDKFNFVTQSLVVGGIEKLKESMESLADSVVELTTRSRLSSESLLNISKNFPSLLFDENGNMNQANIVKNIVDILWKGSESSVSDILSTQIRKYYETGEGSEAAWNVFSSFSNLGGASNLAKTWQDWFEKAGASNALTKDELKRLTDNNLKKYSDVEDIFLSHGVVGKWAETISGLVSDIDFASEMRDKYVEYRVNEYDKEIEDLNSIKDTLGDINKQREKELELLKARDALENAKNERKRVYRAGVGFTYEADQSAIAEAQERVDQLEAKRTQEDIEYQISLLEQQKAILENLSKDEQMEQLVETMKDFSDKFVNNFYGAKGALSSIAFLDMISENVKKVSDQADAQKRYDDTAENLFKEYQNAESALSSFQNNLITNKTWDDLKSDSSIISKRYNGQDMSYNQLQQSLSSETDEDKKNEIQKLIDEWEEEAKMRLDDKSNPEIKRLKEKQNELIKARNKAGSVFVDGSAAYSGTNANISGFDRDNFQNIDFVDVPTEYQKDINGVKLIFSEQDRAIDPGKFAVQGGLFGVTKYMKPGDTQWQDGKSIASLEAMNNLPNGTLFYQQSGQSSDLAYYDDQHILRVPTFDSGEEASVSNHTGLSAIPLIGGIFASIQMFKLQRLWDLVDQIGSSNAKGNLSFRGGSTLINENGLEGIVTPQGTLTSLPARSGILPADLTKNLWTLGELAPGLVSRLGSIEPQIDDRNMTEDNSIHIATLNATFTATNDFDMNKFLRDVRSVVSTTNNL